MGMRLKSVVTDRIRQLEGLREMGAATEFDDLALDVLQCMRRFRMPGKTFMSMANVPVLTVKRLVDGEPRMTLDTYQRCRRFIRKLDADAENGNPWVRPPNRRGAGRPQLAVTRRPRAQQAGNRTFNRDTWSWDDMQVAA